MIVFLIALAGVVLAIGLTWARSLGHDDEHPILKGIVLVGGLTILSPLLLVLFLALWPVMALGRRRGWRWVEWGEAPAAREPEPVEVEAEA